MTDPPRTTNAHVAAVWAAALASVGPVVGGLLGRWAWWLDGWNAFPVHAAVAAAAGAVIAAAWRRAGRRRWAAVFVAGVFAAVGAGRVAGEVGGELHVRLEGEELDVMVANVLTANRDFDRFLRVVREDPPEVLCVLETDAGWAAALETLKDEYPYRFAAPRTDNFGITVLSKRAWSEAREVTLGTTPSVEMAFDFGGRALTVIASHPVPPKGAGNWRRRNEQLAATAARVRELGGEAVVAGDLNCPPWSPFYEDFKRAGGLHDGRRIGAGLSTTWPAGRWWMRTPIDHVLATEGLVFNRYEVGPKTGSDHLPVRARLVPR